MRRLALALSLLASGVHAAPRTVDPDWPCQQVKVAELSLGAFWGGPSVDLSHAAWRGDPATVALVGEVTQRRLPLEDAQRRIDAFAKRDGIDRAAALTNLLAGVFTELNAERESVMAGLGRFGQRQKALAENLRAEGEALRTAQSASASSDAATVSDLTQRLNWDVQLFEARRQSLSIACNIPSVIEQRLFALSRAIQQDLD